MSARGSFMLTFGRRAWHCPVLAILPTGARFAGQGRRQGRPAGPSRSVAHVAQRPKALDADLSRLHDASAGRMAPVCRLVTRLTLRRADSAISAIDTITCSGTATSPGGRSGWARRRSF